MKKILLILLFIPFFSFSQEEEHKGNSCGFACTHNNELAIGIGVLPNHDFSVGFHAHYIKGIALDNKLGLGIGFETILEEHTHNSYNLMCVYRFGSNINGFLSIAYGAGVLRSSEESHEEHEDEEHEEKITSSFAQHVEIVYELNHKRGFCYGPVLDIGFDNNEIHYMIGFHIGRVF
jgi:hypothetical protein